MQKSSNEHHDSITVICRTATLQQVALEYVMLGSCVAAEEDSVLIV